VAHWREARTLYQQALDLSNEIQKRNPAFRSLATHLDPQSIPRELAAIDKVLAGL
jgi:hypothetical protein